MTHIIIIDPSNDAAAGIFVYAESVLNDLRDLLPSLRAGTIVRVVGGWRHEVTR